MPHYYCAYTYISDCMFTFADSEYVFNQLVKSSIVLNNIRRTPEIGQGPGRILSCVARKPEKT